MTHICICRQTIIGSDNGLSPGRCQAIIWTNAGILLIGTLRTNFSEILSKIHTFSFKKNAFENGVWEMASILSRPQCVNSSRPSDYQSMNKATIDSDNHNGLSFADHDLEMQRARSSAAMILTKFACLVWCCKGLMVILQNLPLDKYFITYEYTWHCLVLHCSAILKLQWSTWPRVFIRD